MIHPSAIVSKKATIDDNVTIGAFSIIHDNVQIKSGTIIESFCELGIESSLSNKAPLKIGKNSKIRSHSIFYESSTFGDQLVTGHRVTVRENTTAGNGFQIGTLSDIQGYCSFGEYVKLHSNVHIGQKSAVGDYVWIFPYVVLTNDPHPPSTILQGVTVNNYAVIATMSVILPDVVIGEGALIAAHSMVNKDVSPNIVVGGSPAKFLCETKNIKFKENKEESVYPWRKHFHRGYPQVVVEQWIKEFTDQNIPSTNKLSHD